jgi:acetoin utilization deacetylase AcuC-like enzyme
MKKVGFVYDDVFLRHTPPAWHPERKERLISIIGALKTSGLWDSLIQIRPRRASFDDIALVHTRQYIEMIKNFSGESLDPDTYLSEESLDAALNAAGALMVAIDRCSKGDIERAFCAVRPPGHHAEPDSAMGFCIFNNVAIGASYALKAGFEKVFIVDFDAHHGNGTQHIFEESDSVFFFSTHQYPYYPESGKDSERGKGKGQGYTYNVPILRGAGNKDYICVYQDILPGLIRRFSPDVMLVSAGYDIHLRDSHADIRVTDEGIRCIVRSILTAHHCPVIFTLEGGYDLEALEESVEVTIEEMLRY